MEVTDFIIISLLVLIVITLIIGLYLYFLSSRSKEEDSNSEDLKKINATLASVQNNSNQIQAAVQSFKNPMDSLNRYLSGSSISGVIGEWGLEAIITETLSSNQYEKDFMIIPESRNRVEFAIKMPEGLYLPVDSKFHSGIIDKYEKFMELSSQGANVKDKLNEIRKDILDSLKRDADDISKKYMQEGITVDVGIMFLASESLNLVIDTPDFKKRNSNISIREEIYNRYRILIMGPNSFAAYLTSIRMGFNTLKINETAKEIVKDLGKVSKEFNKFSKSTELLIKNAESLLNRAHEQGIRERAMNRILENLYSKDVTIEKNHEN